MLRTGTMPLSIVMGYRSSSGHCWANQKNGRQAAVIKARVANRGKGDEEGLYPIKSSVASMQRRVNGASPSTRLVRPSPLVQAVDTPCQESSARQRGLQANTIG